MTFIVSIKVRNDAACLQATEFILNEGLSAWGVYMSGTVLDQWSKRENDFSWSTSLVVGNGLSRNISTKFSYTSLHQEAETTGLLTPVAQALFQRLNGTDNFEEILDSLAKGLVIAEVLGPHDAALGQHKAEIAKNHSDVRLALLGAVKAVHVSAAAFAISRRGLLGEQLKAHSRVFTVNYDLLPYWSLMQNPGPGGFADYFWSLDGLGSTLFDVNDTGSFADRTLLHYLHGASHLWTAGSAEGKWISNGDLLDLDASWLAHPTRLPLFVSEGSTAAKRQSIARSQYLTFALGELQRDAQPTVLFGVGLGPQDLHIAEAIAAGPPRQIAVSIWPDLDPDTVALEKARYAKLLRGNGNTLQFYDSTSHPLGDLALQVP